MIALADDGTALAGGGGTAGVYSGSMATPTDGAVSPVTSPVLAAPDAPIPSAVVPPSVATSSPDGQTANLTGADAGDCGCGGSSSSASSSSAGALVPPALAIAQTGASSSSSSSSAPETTAAASVPDPRDALAFVGKGSLMLLGLLVLVVLANSKR